MSKYDFNTIEKKWRKKWEENPIQKNSEKKPKFYCLDMFPYPSGTGLHVGHWRGYVLSDVLSRHKILQGFHVLHPMGWDAFGLPAENNAIKKGIHPSISTAENVASMKRQLNEMSTIYDWNYEIDTTDPKYYKWTQWIFARMFEKGLAYEKEMPLNWCPTCKVVLANEEAVGGVCERCKGESTKKNLRQWMLKITAYAERLLADLEGLDWPEKVRKMQADWVGKSHGAEVEFTVNASSAGDGAQAAQPIIAYTTRPDTLYGATFMVLAPEHELVSKITTQAQKAAVDAYVMQAASRSNVDRMSGKEKTGVFTGVYATNPLTGRTDMPVWVADYVLADYGTGAIMCVPAHDERDFEFAQKFDLPIVEVISPTGNASAEPLSQAYVGDGVLVNSEKFDGLNVKDAIAAITKELEKTGKGKETTNYKLRDWVFSRQRYWGEPIPIIHCETCGPVLVPDSELPVMLPNVESYQPTDTGESPLALVKEWVNTTCPKCGAPAKRETNTMPQWAGSSWYFLRYSDVNNDSALASAEALKKWLPVDYYVGGVEHAVLHLLYARFYTKFLYDIGVVDFQEPFTKLFNQGMINRNGKKMAKSFGNGVSPDELLPKYGCDALRMYELFIGPPELDAEWDDSGIEGVYRFLNKIWRIANEPQTAETPDFERLRHRLIHDITTRLENLSLNTVISGFMEHTNTLQSLAKNSGGIPKTVLETLAVLLSPFAPHIAEEIWEQLGNTTSVFAQTWPTYDESKLQSDTIEIAMQINGKLRGNIQIAANANKDDVLAQAKTALADKLAGAAIVKEIYVPGKIVNFVVKG
ncbi:MAG: leucine--tRNA ligase [Defluviitaleaceae bacterium]|nr:leucine--tRNA ligase [Defluviitaleaceae bacterium]MCL2263791.1 leucine--tRNA ligase [Defluviitaleaceae bacterium]